MHHKRKRPKSGRAGCLLCKPHKRQGSCRHQRAKPSDRRRAEAAAAELKAIVAIVRTADEMLGAPDVRS